MDANELAEIFEGVKFTHQVSTETIHNAAAELRRLKALEKDAMRYQWLKRRLYRGDVDVAEAYITMKVVGSCPGPEEIDASIDAAMENK